MDRSVKAASPSWIQSRLVHWRAGVLTTAVVVILDAQGKVVYTGVGTGQELEAEVAKVLGG